MLISELLHIEDKALMPTDDNSTAKRKFVNAKNGLLPIVDENQQVIGVLNEGDFINEIELNTAIADYSIQEVLTINETSHIYEVARIMLINDVEYLAMVDYDGRFKKIIFKQDVISALIKMQNLDANGSTIAIDISDKDYSLSDIIRIIEMEGAKILAMSVQIPDNNNTRYQLSVKINLEDSSVVSAALTRYGYIITSEENSEMLEHELSERADELLRYLDI